MSSDYLAVDDSGGAEAPGGVNYKRLRAGYGRAWGS